MKIKNDFFTSSDTISEQVRKRQGEIIRLHFEHEERALQAAFGLMFPEENVMDESKITKNVTRGMGEKGDIVVWKYKGKAFLKRREVKPLSFKYEPLAFGEVLD